MPPRAAGGSGSLERLVVERWIAEFLRCWRESDAEGVVGLFTPDAIYRSGPFRPAAHGSAAIRAYWIRSTGAQRQIRVVAGEPVIEGNRAAVEWWASWTEEGRPVTLPGCMVVRLTLEGRCEELREYWQFEQAERPVPDGWGR